MSVTYLATITQFGNNTGIPVPDEVVEQLGAGRRPAILVELDGYELRTTLGSMSGTAMIPFSAAHRRTSGLSGGDQVTVRITVDTTPRAVEVPDDLAAALDQAPEARRAFDALPPSHRRAHVEHVEDAKKPETRERRIVRTVERLRP